VHHPPQPRKQTSSEIRFVAETRFFYHPSQQFDAGKDFISDRLAFSVDFHEAVKLRISKGANMSSDPIACLRNPLVKLHA